MEHSILTQRGFEVVRKLGEGAYSSVYKVRRISDGMDYAMKSIKMGILSPREQENAVNEVRFLASLNSPDIVSYKEAFFEERSGMLHIIMEYCAGGDLLNKIRFLKRKNQFLDEKVIWLYILQMTRGLRTLHEKNIVHRDFKCANVMLIRDHTSLKLGDLNVSKVAKGGLLYTQTGTPYYASPEIWRDKPYNSKSDVWSLGCVVYELITLNPPFKAQDMEGLFKKISKGTYDSIPAWYSKDLSDFLDLCIQVNPKSRFTTQELLDSPLLLQRKNIAEELNVKNPYMEFQFNCSPVKSELLKTLKIGKNLIGLNSILPEPQYDNSTAGSTPDQTAVGDKNLLEQLPNISNISIVKVQKSELLSKKQSSESIFSPTKANQAATPIKVVQSKIKGSSPNIKGKRILQKYLEGAVYSQHELSNNSNVINNSSNIEPKQKFHSEADMEQFEQAFKPTKVLRSSRRSSIEVQNLKNHNQNYQGNNQNSIDGSIVLPSGNSHSSAQINSKNQSPQSRLVFSKIESTPSLPLIDSKRAKMESVHKEYNNMFNQNLLIPVRNAQQRAKYDQSTAKEAIAIYLPKRINQIIPTPLNLSKGQHPSPRTKPSEVLLFAGKKLI